MTLLLASVNGPAEAEGAIARGADIIDVRGAASPEGVRAVLAAVADRRPVSAGESDAAAVEAFADAGVDYVRSSRARAVLAHPRAANVTVRVEKLDTGSGNVGVEIARGRPAEAATVHHLFGAGESDPKASG